MSKRIKKLKAEIRNRIMSGAPGFIDGLPSIRDLTAMLNESRYAVSTALKTPDIPMIPLSEIERHCRKPFPGRELLPGWRANSRLLPFLLQPAMIFRHSVPDDPERHKSREELIGWTSEQYGPKSAAHAMHLPEILPGVSSGSMPGSSPARIRNL